MLFRSPYQAHDVTLFFPLVTIGVGEHEAWEAEELLMGGRHLWQGSHQRVRLEPDAPARIWRTRHWRSNEHGFNTFMEPTVVRW